jgi:hypothetical protein
MSCSHEENISVYFDSESMAPPVDEPFSLEVVGGSTAQKKYIEDEIQTGATRTALALDTPDEDYMVIAHHTGLRVLFWTADNSYDSVETDRFTADGVVTDKPLMWKDWAARIPKESKTL